VVDAICIVQHWDDDVRVVLLTVLRERQSLDDELIKTISGKIVELTVRKVVHSEVVKNTDALTNPEALAYFANLAELAPQQ